MRATESARSENASNLFRLFNESEYTKNGTAADAAAKDAAVVCSIALQYGVPLDVISHALLRDPRGKASSPLGVALDMIGEAAP